jgi:hypothetical protein
MGCDTPSDRGTKELLSSTIRFISWDGIIKGLLSLTEALTSLDGRVPASKSNIVVFPFPSFAHNGLKESTNGGSSGKLGFTLSFLLSYLDFCGKAISFGRKSGTWGCYEGSLVVMGRILEETLDFFPSGSEGLEVSRSVPFLFLVNCTLDPSGNNSSPKPSI